MCGGKPKQTLSGCSRATDMTAAADVHRKRGAGASVCMRTNPPLHPCSLFVLLQASVSMAESTLWWRRVIGCGSGVGGHRFDGTVVCAAAAAVVSP